MFLVFVLRSVVFDFILVLLDRVLTGKTNVHLCLKLITDAVINLQLTIQQGHVSTRKEINTN